MTLGTVLLSAPKAAVGPAEWELEELVPRARAWSEQGPQMAAADSLRETDS